LHEREAQLRQGVAQWRLVLPEAITDTVEERSHGVDRESSLRESDGSALVRRQVQHGQLPEPDGVVGHEVRH
jgi:hypothetical protein